jgi:hypothetical protein
LGRSPAELGPYFTVSFETPQLGGPGPQVKIGHITTDGRSVSMSWCRARSGTCDQIFPPKVAVLPLWGALSDLYISHFICPVPRPVACLPKLVSLQLTRLFLIMPCKLPMPRLVLHAATPQVLVIICVRRRWTLQGLSS